MPWYVDTRLLFYRRDLLAQRRLSPRRRASWAEWTRDAGRGQGSAPAPDRYAILLPLNEFEPLLALALQQDEPLLRDDGRWGNFDSAGFRRALALLRRACSRSGFAPPTTDADVSNVWNEFGRGYFAFYISGPWNIGEFKRRLPAERAGELDDRAAARARTGPARRSPAARASSCSARRGARTRRGS